MKNLKKITCLTILVGAMVLSVAACNNNKPASTTTAAATTTTAATTVAESTEADKTEDSGTEETEATADTDVTDEGDPESDVIDISGKTFAAYDAGDDNSYTTLSEYHTFNADGSGSVDNPDGIGSIPTSWEAAGVDEEGRTVLKISLGSADNTVDAYLFYNEDALYMTTVQADGTESTMKLEETEGVTGENAGDADADMAAKLAAINELDPLLGNFAGKFASLPFSLTYRATTDTAVTTMTMAIGGETKAYISTIVEAADGNNQAFDILYDGDAMYMIDTVNKTATKTVLGSDSVKTSVSQSNTMFNITDASNYTVVREDAEINGEALQAVKLTDNSTGVETIIYFDADGNARYMASGESLVEILNITNDVDADLFVVPEDIEITEINADGTPVEQ